MGGGDGWEGARMDWRGLGLLPTAGRGRLPGLGGPGHAGSGSLTLRLRLPAQVTDESLRR